MAGRFGNSEPHESLPLVFPSGTVHHVVPWLHTKQTIDFPRLEIPPFSHQPNSTSSNPNASKIDNVLVHERDEWRRVCEYFGAVCCGINPEAKDPFISGFDVRDLAAGDFFLQSQNNLNHQQNQQGQADAGLRCEAWEGLMTYSHVLYLVERAKQLLGVEQNMKIDDDQNNNNNDDWICIAANTWDQVPRAVAVDGFDASDDVIILVKKTGDFALMVCLGDKSTQFSF